MSVCHHLTKQCKFLANAFHMPSKHFLKTWNIKISEITRNHWHFTKLWEQFRQHSDVESKNVFSSISQDTFMKKFESQTPDETNINAIVQCSRLLFDVQLKFFSFPFSISSNFVDRFIPQRMFAINTRKMLQSCVWRQISTCLIRTSFVLFCKNIRKHNVKKCFVLNKKGNLRQKRE